MPTIIVVALVVPRRKMRLVLQIRLFITCTLREHMAAHAAGWRVPTLSHSIFSVVTQQFSSCIPTSRLKHSFKGVNFAYPVDPLGGALPSRCENRATSLLGHDTEGTEWWGWCPLTCSIWPCAPWTYMLQITWFDALAWLPPWGWVEQLFETPAWLFTELSW